VATRLLTVRRLVGRVLTTGRRRGHLAVAVAVLRWVAQWALGFLRARGPARRTFVWEGRQVPYFHHRYNHTWLNERAVEAALAREVLASYAGARVLEVGNVMGHYLPGTTHTVVDKYEQAPGVLNADVVELDEEERYDLVLSVSTLEHVGWDEDVVDPEKPGRAVEALKRSLAPGGLLWLTLPIGYNPHLDRRLRDGVDGFTRLRALRREAARNVWREVPLDQVWDAGYDRLLYTAHGLVVAEFHRPER
jgi:SAM-dependent methyltransferase